MKNSLIFEISGAWLVLIAFISLPPVMVMLNYLFCGIIVMSSGIIIRSKNTLARMTFANIGLWLIISAYVPNLLKIPNCFWNELMIGVSLIVLSIASTNPFYKKLIGIRKF